MSDIEFDHFDFLDGDGETPDPDPDPDPAPAESNDWADPIPAPRDDEWSLPPPSERSLSSMRDYQYRAVQGVYREWRKGNKATLIVHPTGSGKTYTFAGVIAGYDAEFGPRPDGTPRRFLILAHRDYLHDQAAKTLVNMGIDSAIERGSKKALASLFGDPNCVIASVQSMQHNQKTKRLLTWDADYFDAIVVDECFPAGTLVDGIPIETLRVGDLVSSFNHTTGCVRTNKVARLFKSRPTGLVRVHFSDRRSIVCTPGHSFYVAGKYVEARYLSRYDVVQGITSNEKGIHYGDSSERVRGVRDRLCAEELEYEHGPDLLGAMQKGAAGCKGESHVHAVHRMRLSRGMQGAERAEDGQYGAGLLFARMSEEGSFSEILRDDGEHKSKICISPDESQESDARSGDPGQGQHETPGDGLDFSVPGRQRERPYCASDVDCLGLGLGDGTCRPHGGEEVQHGKAPDLLQDRRGQPRAQSGDRDRRFVSLYIDEESSRPEERGISPVAWVDRIEVLEPGGDGRFRGLCPNGYVYNIEVEGDHNYFAGGILVHNCHHVISPTYKRILNYFNWEHLLLVTATPDRLDGRSLGEVVDSVADEYPLDQAVDDGWVCGVEVAWVDVSVDISRVKTKRRGKSRDLNESDLAESVRPYIQKFARGIKRVIGDRPSILFAPSVLTSHFMSTALTSLGIKSMHLDANSKNRDEVLHQFKEGYYQCLCNYGLFTEGFDMPSIGAVILLRATESRALYYQMVGRGLRPNDGKKLLIVDFPWVSGSHKLIHPVQIFHGDRSRFNEEVFREAERILDVGSTNDLLDAIKQADQEVAQRERFKLEVTDGPVNLRKLVYDPLNSDDTSKLPRKRQSEERRMTAATFKQVAILQYNGIAGAEAMDKRRASAIISAIKKREAKGLAPYSLVNTLVRSGVDRREARLLSKVEAERIVADARNFGFGRDLFGN